MEEESEIKAFIFAIILAVIFLFGLGTEYYIFIIVGISIISLKGILIRVGILKGEPYSIYGSFKILFYIYHSIFFSLFFLVFLAKWMIMKYPNGIIMLIFCGIDIIACSTVWIITNNILHKKQKQLDKIQETHKLSALKSTQKCPFCGNSNLETKKRFQKGIWVTELRCNACNKPIKTT